MRNVVRSREIGTATIDCRRFPLKLIETFDTQVVANPEIRKSHVHRQQAFLDFSSRPTEGGDIDGVDRIDPPLDKRTLTPAHHLATQARIQEHIPQLEVSVDEGVEDLSSGELGVVVEAIVAERLPAGIAVDDITPGAVAIFQLEVIPVFTAGKQADILVAQFKVMHTLENLREGIALVEVQVSVVINAVIGNGHATAVKTADQRRIPVFCTPGDTHRYLRIEVPFDFAEVEIHGLGATPG